MPCVCRASKAKQAVRSVSACRVVQAFLRSVGSGAFLSNVRTMHPAIAGSMPATTKDMLETEAPARVRNLGLMIDGAA